MRDRQEEHFDGDEREPGDHPLPANSLIVRAVVDHRAAFLMLQAKAYQHGVSTDRYRARVESVGVAVA